MAGVTLLAFGSASPEIVLNSIAAFEQTISLSMNAVLGSAMIAFGLIPALCMWVAPSSKIRLHSGPVLREILFYCASLFIFIRAIHDGEATVLEAFSLVLVYVGKRYFLQQCNIEFKNFSLIVYLSLVVGIFLIKKGDGVKIDQDDDEDSSMRETESLIPSTASSSSDLPASSPIHSPNTFLTSRYPSFSNSISVISVMNIISCAELGIYSSWNGIRYIATIVFNSTIPSLHFPSVPSTNTSPTPTSIPQPQSISSIRCLGEVDHEENFPDDQPGMKEGTNTA